MNYKKLIPVFLSVLLSACVTTHQSVAPNQTNSNFKKVKVMERKSSEDIYPEHSYPVGDSGFQLVQAAGGSVFLGPVLGSMNIAKNSKEVAQSIQALTLISPYELAKKTLRNNHFTLSNDAVLMITPFIFLQKGDDGFYRLSLVHHVKDAGNKWVGRYTYHLEEAVKIDDFPSGISTPAFESAFNVASQKLVDLMNLDFSGQLPNEGVSHNIGSLHFVGAKMGGMGIYTQPEELYFQNAKVIQETETDIIVRMQGNYNLVQFMGGLTFGVHYFKKSSLHRLEATNK
ncbi:hypothetical protein L1286_16695 [Pseudoalteromonas sp. SMS1]|uniref:hypothetical protein n=1 Tax=Pseudoalteromonas sp. SMS1 TaxID=2908894 RepID=UPI001F26997F|nr:hypothetical protein [Pseudoalteromonas sp. SMS1]MCF2859123.1 hypothetical protein [Pseudoalteromonas sp. SMS1]